MDIVEKVARAIVQALTEDAGGWGYVGRDEDLNNTVLDGHFDLIKSGRAAIRATLEHYRDNPPPVTQPKGDWDYGDEERVFRAMITQALKELDRSEGSSHL